MELGISSSKLFYLFVFGCFALYAFMDYGSINAQLISEDEVKVLKEISSKIDNLHWNVTPHSCIDGGFKDEIIDYYYLRSNATCNCNFSNGKVCHVTNISMLGLNLSGILPSEFGNLTHLQELDLSLNCLSGSIPKSCARLPLVTLQLTGNPISGQIPEEIGEITTLEELYLNDNMLEGPLPSSLGKLWQLRELYLAGNDFSGTIPESFDNLAMLEYISLDGTSIRGKIPNFIGNWTQLDSLSLMGTSMEGPIPSTISHLANLTSLYISDLHGPATKKFPNLENLTSLRYLVLRNCSIYDSIPDYIGHMRFFYTLDLSFNKLIGEIPNNISHLVSLDHMFLTENSLSGKVPEWILQNADTYIDLSYNNFSETSASLCQYNNINLGSSMSSSTNTSSTCLKRGLPCAGKPKYYSLFIYCGGSEIEYDGNKYEADTNPGAGNI